MQIGSIPSYIPRELPGLDRTPAPARPAKDTSLAGAAAAKAAGAVDPSTFGNALQRAVGAVDAKMRAGQAEQAKVLTGESSNLHQAVIAMQEANVAFSLMVEVRNKLVESYQELMRMQV